MQRLKCEHELRVFEEHKEGASRVVRDLSCIWENQKFDNVGYGKEFGFY